MSTAFLEFPTEQSPSEIAPADAAARAAALNPTRSFLVEAPAGSGKTGLLVQRLLTLLCRVEHPESVLALTFTNKATAEMRERILKALDLVSVDPATLNDFERTTRELAATLLQHDSDRRWNLRQNSHRLNIRTIDSLCGEIARSLPLSSGAVGQMAPLDDARPLYRRAARAVTLQLGGDNATLNAALRTVLLHRDADLQNCEALLAEMLGTREQWGWLIPLSPESLNDDFLEAEVKPRLDRTLELITCQALTSLERAFPADLLHELTGLAVQLAAAEGHRDKPNPIASCASLRTAPGSAGADVDHWVHLASLLLKASKPFEWRKRFSVSDIGLHATPQQRLQLKDLVQALEADDTLRQQLCNLRDLPPRAMPAEDWRVTKALFHLLHFAVLELRGIFRDTGTCDFTERSLAAHIALKQAGQGASKQPLEGMDLQHLLVDEMQDTSSAQYELLELLTREWDGTRRTVFLVGDPKQSIYVFRQARVERFIASLTSGKLGDVPLTTLRLSTNFRSTRPLVDQFNGMFDRVFRSSGAGEIVYSNATAARATEPGRLCWNVCPLPGDLEPEERRQRHSRVQREQASHIVQTIRRLREQTGGGKPFSFAVLVRNREHASAVTRALRKAGIAFRGVELEPLNEQPEVLDSLALTRALLHPADRVAWLAVLRAPWCGTTLADLHHLSAGDEPHSRTRAPRTLFRERAVGLQPSAQARVLRTLNVLDGAAAAVGRMPLAELVDRTTRALGANHFRTDLQRTNVQRFLELLEKAEAELRPLTAEDLQTRLSRLYAEPGAVPGAVDIMTIHKAKGLEWDVVFVPELHRLSSGHSQRLLDWLEVPGLPAEQTRASDSQAPEYSESSSALLLAPVPPRGVKGAELPRYVQAARRRQEGAELARLLYVVLTRARRELYLYAAPELKKDDGQVSHRAGTLLGTAWPAVGEQVQRLADEQRENPGNLPLLHASGVMDEEPVRNLADLRRVPDGFDPAALRRPLLLPWLKAAVSKAQDKEGHVPLLEEVHRAEGSLAARAFGSAMHLFLEQLAAEIESAPALGVDGLLSRVETWPSRIHATLRSMGTHGRALERDTTSILAALRNTLQHPDGWWLLQPLPRAATERSLLLEDRSDGVARTLRLDRSFIAVTRPGTHDRDGEEALWVVDYKTATPGEATLDAFLAEQRARYAPQLRNYARLLSAQPGSPGRIMLALYYPLVPVLDAWEYKEFAGV